MNNQKQTLSVLRPILLGLCVGVVCCTLLLLLAAWGFRTVDVPLGAVTPVAVIAAALSALLGGFVAAKAAGCRGLLMGGGCGLTLFLLILLIGLIRGNVEVGYAVIKLAALTLSGAIGGVLGVNRKRR